MSFAQLTGRTEQDARTVLHAGLSEGEPDARRELAVALAADTPGFLATAIPNASIVEQMGVERAPLAVYAPTSPAAAAFANLWAEIAERLWA